MIKDCQNYLKQNKQFLQELSKDIPIVMEYINDAIKVLNYVIDHPSEVDDVLSLIFDTTFSYLHLKLETIKLIKMKYLTNPTDGLNYGSYVAYWLFVEDVIEALEEKDQYSEKIKNEAEAIISTIEKTLKNKIIFEENSLESFDQRLGAVLPSRDQVLTTPEILALICEELMI